MTISPDIREPLLDAEFLRKLERLAIAAKKTQLGVNKGERRSKRKGVSVEFADYRNYVQGDDLRFIDWNIAGRLDALYLKLFQEQEDLTVHLLIDASASMGLGEPSKIGFARRLAAAIGYIALVGYDRVSVEAFSGAGIQRLAPCRGKASAHKLFAFLQSLSSGGGTSLEASCKSYVNRNRARGVALLFSDFFDEAGFDACLRRLQGSGSDCYAVHVLSPDEIDPPITGDLKLLDSETNAYTEISASRTLLDRYKKNLEGFCESIRKTCLARGMAYVPASTGVSVEQLTLDVLRRGGMLR